MGVISEKVYGCALAEWVCFDALMCNEMNCGVMVTSCRHKVVEGTYCLTCDAVYSETRGIRGTQLAWGPRAWLCLAGW